MTAYHDHEVLLTEDFTNLGFVLTTRRFTLLLKLALAYARSEMRTITVAEFEGTFRVKQNHKLDMIAVHFIQHHGDDLWPTFGFMTDNRKHLNDGSSIQGRLAWISQEHQNCKNFGAQDRTLWDEKIRSPLGQAVRKYFGLVADLPAEVKNSHQEQERDVERLKSEVLSV